MIALDFQKVSYRYPLSPRSIVNHFDLKILSGEVVAIIGQNGTGKSTLFKLALGGLKPSSGRVLFQGQSITDYGVTQRASKIISLTQRVDQSLFMDLSLAENLDLWRYRFGLTLSNQELLQSLSFKERLENLSLHAIRSLSGGEQQLLISSLVFSASPELLFLDEHTSQLDPHISEAIMIDLLHKAKKNKTTVLMITHDLQDALSYADRIIILRYKKNYIEYVKQSHTTLSELKEAML